MLSDPLCTKSHLNTLLPNGSHMGTLQLTEVLTPMLKLVRPNLECVETHFGGVELHCGHVLARIDVLRPILLVCVPLARSEWYSLGHAC